MRSAIISRLLGIGVLAIVVTAVVACSTPASPDVPAGAADPSTEAVGADFGDPCSLLTQPELATVFPDGVPEAVRTSYGAGFVECLWEDAAGQIVRLSVVPPENLQSDYIDQLVIRDEVVGLGAGSVTFPGMVGIGVAKSGGITAAFTAADTGVLLAVKTGDGTDEEADLIHVTLLGQRLLSRAG